MIAKMSTVILCSKNDKKKLEELELPGLTTIISNQYLEDGKVYMITDEKLKRGLLEADRIRRLREKELSKNKFSQRAEMQRTQLNHYCNNTVTRLDIDVLGRICTVLDCSIGDLLEFLPPEPDSK